MRLLCGGGSVKENVLYAVTFGKIKQCQIQLQADFL